MCASSNSLGRDRRGGSAIEFALIAPVLLALLLGVTEIARFVNQADAVEKSLRSAAGLSHEPRRGMFPGGLWTWGQLERGELELVHDVIAAEWRQRQGAVQLGLPFMNDALRPRLEAAWLRRFRELLDATLDEGEICLPVLRALKHRGTARGNRAERELAAIVVRHLYPRKLPPSEWGWPLGLAADVVRRSSHVCQGHPLAPLFALTAPG